ncbi:MAG: nicotinamide-nucleotide amidohydrolase family protein, partial [Candidatus Omnitrophota bacterium]
KNKEIALRGISQIESVIRKRFGEYIFGKDEETLEEVVGRVLTKKRKTLAVAESCSGGLIAHRLTNVPGSSHYFISGIVAYSQKEKVRLLKVPVEVIKKYGAVSKEVAEIMAKNVRKMAKADIGIGVTGIAGPKGGSSDKPVGLVYIGISTENKTEVKEYRFSGERFVIKLKASQEALDIVRKKLLR